MPAAIKEGIGVVSDIVNHPPHYTQHPSGVECITITEWLNFNLGNAFKYLFRRKMKGRELEDVKKALWYVERQLAWERANPSPVREVDESAWEREPLVSLLERVNRVLAREEQDVWEAMWRIWLASGEGCAVERHLESAVSHLQLVLGRLTK